MVITSSSERDRATGESALYTWTGHLATDLMGGVEEAACLFVGCAVFSSVATHDKALRAPGPQGAFVFRTSSGCL